MADNKTKLPNQVWQLYWCPHGRDTAHRRQDACQIDAKASRRRRRCGAHRIIGFGSHHYRYDSGREGDMPLIAFSPRKTATVLYNVIGFSGSDGLLAKLGEHTTGKGCLYIKKLPMSTKRC